MSFFDGLNQDVSKDTGGKLYAAGRAQGLSPQDAWQQANQALSQLGLQAMAPPQEVIDARNQTGGNASQFDPTTGQLLPPGSTKSNGAFEAGGGGLFPKLNASDAQYIVAHPDMYPPDGATAQAANALLRETHALTGGGGVGQNYGLAQTDPAKYKLQQMHLAALGLQAQRPAMEQSRVNALQNQLAAYGPMNQVMGSMYGPGMKMDFSKMGQSPLVPGQTQIGAPNTSDIGLQSPLLQLQNGKQ